MFLVALLAGCEPAAAPTPTPPTRTPASAPTPPAPPPRAVAPASPEVVPDAPEDPVITGALTEADVATVLARHRNQMRYCYQRELARDPGLAGTLVAQVDLQPDGMVKEARSLSSDLGDKTTSCVIGRFRRIQFPGTADGHPASLRLTYRFSP